MSERPEFNVQRRQYFRIAYPPEFAPGITIRVTTYRVLDLCEKGVRFSNPTRLRMPEDLFQATIQFYKGETVAVTARLLRVLNTTEYVLELIRGVPYTRIMSEQALLRKVQRG